MLHIPFAVLLWAVFIVTNANHSVSTSNRTSLRAILDLQRQTWTQLGSEIDDMVGFPDVFQNSKIAWGQLNLTFTAYFEETEDFLSLMSHENPNALRVPLRPAFLASTYHAVRKSNHLSAILSKITTQVAVHLLPRDIQTIVLDEVEYRLFTYMEELVDMMVNKITYTYCWGATLRSESLFKQPNEAREALGRKLAASRLQARKTARIEARIRSVAMQTKNVLDFHQHFIDTTLCSLAVWDVENKDSDTGDVSKMKQWSANVSGQCAAQLGKIISPDSPEGVSCGVGMQA